MQKGRVFVLGDIHGAYRALIQVFKKSDFNLSLDKLIFLGDLVDGYSQSKECIDLLKQVKNLIMIMGNHDEMALTYYRGRDHYLIGKSEKIWLNQGGISTIKSLGEKKHIDEKYLAFLEKGLRYYEYENNIFAHAEVPKIINGKSKEILENTSPELFAWNRDMVFSAYQNKEDRKWSWGNEWGTIYVGHTPVLKFKDTLSKPCHWGNVILMDTGAGWGRRLSLLEIHSGQLYQSELTSLLYPDECPR